MAQVDATNTELGAYVGDSGDYTIDFTETTADPN